jgi:4-hydroxy-tetrahydrodipicolinate reductase
MTRKLALVGMGKMGKAIAEIAPSRDWEVVARLDGATMKRGISSADLNGADVAIEFTVPHATPANVRALVAAGVPVVVGTTGWYDQLPTVSDEVRANGGTMIAAANFSLGVNIFEKIAETAARLLGRTSVFSAQIVETHHAAKLDAPSGTAATLRKSSSAAWGRGEIPITSIRTGSVPGTHEFIFDAPFETIHLEHVARDRRVFAEGALVAAGWLIGKKGVFTMRDVLGTGQEAAR